MSHGCRGLTEPGQNDLLALAVLWDCNDHGQRQNCRTVCTGDGCKEYSWVRMETSFLSVLTTVMGVYPKVLLPQASIFIFNSWDYNGTWQSFQGSELSSELDSSDK